ncbi:bifunctional adenosylcobinamide kinase/adenosylcobinamide-phosphate guanylyltransferase [Nocardioides oleivorans]|uniref:Adenosylcobinamide kinase n=1 Tax=Nocardioides oleivorans TaxID=273676 RepID=A0A4Q2RMH6_9ACTN|nr:bifunctional adenosylcobinamide kinase/adenosylcobinamide-phosphate guanylyltransferase [Nocardioides oleivorans]RYB90030.1 bifunctional adenosylcobinamide kinase/adenosylcobinamide-phosphate guanylyltransferase [Nocardioides oleivorans]
MRILVTGGVRSGKSSHAEALLGDEPATYVAAGPSPDVETDPDWAARIDAHRSRRPGSWTTLESRDLAGAIRSSEVPVLIDCLGTWLTAVVDEAGAWEAENDAALGLVVARADEVVDALQACEQDVVLVTNEVGLGVVPEHRSGRLFRDLLGTVNQRVAAACDEVHLVVAGRVLRL